MDWFDYSRIKGIKLCRNNVKIAPHDGISQEAVALTVDMEI